MAAILSRATSMPLPHGASRSLRRTSSSFGARGDQPPSRLYAHKHNTIDAPPFHSGTVVMEQPERFEKAARPIPPAGLARHAIMAAASVSSYSSGSLSMDEFSPLQSVCLEDHMPWEGECSVEAVVNDLEQSGTGCCYVAHIAGACFNHSGSSLDEACPLSSSDQPQRHSILDDTLSDSGEEWNSTQALNSNPTKQSSSGK